MNYSASQIAGILNTVAPAIPDSEIDTLLTDSRALTYPGKSLFFALTTATNDGHRFISGLIDCGVRNFVVKNLPDRQPEGVNFFRVDDVDKALLDIAAFHRRQFSIPVVGITGSRGKTIVKEWINAVLRHYRHTTRSPRSFNSHIGVPLSVWGLEPDTETAIFEAGISAKGEMELLEEVIGPTIGVLTNIGDAHDGGFRDHREKCLEKLKLFRGCKALIYCADDPVVTDTVAQSAMTAELIAWSRTGVEGAIRVTTEEATAGTRLIIYYDGTPFDAVLNFKDAASVENAINAIITLLYLGLSPEQIAAHTGEFRHIDTRLDVIEGVRDCMLIRDSFTNDLDSLEVALDFMTRRLTPDRKSTLILGGFDIDAKDRSAVYKKLMTLLERKNISRLIGIGDDFAAYTGAFSGDVRFFADVPQFLKEMSQKDFNSELILVKGTPGSDIHEVSEMLEARQHETVLEVNLDAIVHNFNEFRSRIRPTTGIVAMVKAFGYGAGSYELAKTLQSQGAAYLAVAVADEGADLRRAGITMPILVLNPRVDSYPMMFEHNLEPEIFSFGLLDQFISEGQRQGVRNYPIHIKLDTGMHRLGFLEKDMPELVRRLQAQDVVSPKSVFSHLAAADDPMMDDYTMEQFALFKRCSDMLQEGFSHHILRHILNSTGITRFPEYQYDMVRLGICLYGIATMDDGSQDGLQPVSSLKTAIISLKEWPAGTTIGYNRRGLLKRDSRIATIPIGYADGMNRHLGNGHTSVFINGHRCPTVGNICMDACMIDVTDVKCEVGDKVEVFGPNIPAEEIAQILDTIPYEVLTSVSARVKRVYYRE